MSKYVKNVTIAPGLPYPRSEEHQHRIVNHIQEPGTHESHGQFEGTPVEKAFGKDKCWDFYWKRQDFHNIWMLLAVRSKCRVQQHRQHAYPGSVYLWEYKAAVR